MTPCGLPRCCLSLLIRPLIWLLACLLSAGGLAPAHAETGELRLAASDQAVPVWPALRVLAESGSPWTWQQARALSPRFAVPAVPAGNFGVQREALWLHLPIQVDSGDAAWMLQIDYAPLNRVEVYHLRDGQLVARYRLGNDQPYAERPWPSRAHVAPLTLEPGVRHELYLRVQTSSSMVLPVQLLRPKAFAAQESATQLTQGLACGLMLMLLIYSLAYWLSLREPMFAGYALLLSGIATFFVAYYGIGQQYLWPEQSGLMAKIAPLSILVALVGGAQFVRLALQPLRSPGASPGPSASGVPRLLNTVSVLGLVTLLASLAGLLDYRHTQLAATLLGPAPMLIPLPGAWRRARHGDGVARLLLLGWLSYSFGALSMAGLLRGVLPANFATQHAFQFATLLEMVLWLRVLGLRLENIQVQAERAQLEKQALVSLAHTDALTGLPNRRGLNQALDQALGALRPEHPLAVFLLDLDGFKPVNDRLGHDAGDELLVQVGQRLRAQLRHSDVVARLGGDEFVIMAPGLGGEADVRRLGGKLLQAFDTPFSVADGQVCRVGLTIGYALAPHDGLAAGDLLKRADAAMYAGKQAGRHCLRRGGASAGLAAG